MTLTRASDGLVGKLLTFPDPGQDSLFAGPNVIEELGLEPPDVLHRNRIQVTAGTQNIETT